MLKPIVILTSPRTGSNLLLYSMALHPQAICAGEYFNDIFNQNRDYVWANKQNRLRECNLYKLHSWDIANERFESVTEGCFLVYLYRRDRAAQLASWKRACETGHWVTGEPPQPTISFLENANELIDQAEAAFRPRANMVVSYETLCDNWLDTLFELQAKADWDIVPLEMATEPTA